MAVAIFLEVLSRWSYVERTIAQLIGLNPGVTKPEIVDFIIETHRGKERHNSKGLITASKITKIDEVPNRGRQNANEESDILKDLAATVLISIWSTSLLTTQVCETLVDRTQHKKKKKKKKKVGEKVAERSTFSNLKEAIRKTLKKLKGKREKLEYIPEEARVEDSLSSSIRVVLASFVSIIWYVSQTEGVTLV
ncbi:unnamed protein product [Sphenostylis stenocarpa]|uniref:Uncharacterized protein n=1 Tax=Sphenostylis stenocarpa TaxID=92480 RepID=A0AA86SHH8_9FABA|nr:unnamed protein product [Sphenostylis stenocarpa]